MAIRNRCILHSPHNVVLTACWRFALHEPLPHDFSTLRRFLDIALVAAYCMAITPTGSGEMDSLKTARARGTDVLLVLAAVLCGSLWKDGAVFLKFWTIRDTILPLLQVVRDEPALVPKELVEAMREDLDIAEVTEDWGIFRRRDASEIGEVRSRVMELQAAMDRAAQSRVSSRCCHSLCLAIPLTPSLQPTRLLVH